MTETKFTPGPWKCDGEESAYYDLPTLNILDKDGDIVAGAVDYIDESGLPNAHLIAAAPDLYEVLQRMVNVASEIAPDVQGANVFTDARNVLAKARGEA